METILVVDDEPDWLALATDILRCTAIQSSRIPLGEVIGIAAELTP